MSENKTPLKQPTWRDKLHTLHTGLQRHLVIGKHKLHKKRQAGAKAFMRWLRAQPIYRQTGRVLYELGFQAEYAVVRTYRAARYGLYAIKQFSVIAGKFIKQKLVELKKFLLDDIFRAPKVFVRGMWRIGRNAVSVTKSHGVKFAWQESCTNVKKGVKEYARLIPRTLSVVVPVVTAVLCLGYVKTTLAKNYALAVQVNDQTVGYVASESVFEAAKQAVGERISYAATSETKWNVVPKYTMAAVSDNSELLTEKRMADAILSTSEDQIREGTALYIDGELRRVTTEGAALASYIEEMKAPHLTDDPNVTVGFNHTVDLVDGIYFNDSFSDIGEIMDFLKSDEIKQESYTLVAGDSISLIASKNGLTQAELYEMNPGLTSDSKLFPGDQMIVQKQEKVLEIRVQKKEVYTEPIHYGTVTKESNDYNYGITKTLVEGQDGERQVTAVKTYDADGNILDTQIVDVQTLREPVTKEVVRGTRLPSGSTAQLGGGTLIWPCPGYRRVSRWAVGRHKGVDITGAVGTPIIAADSGVVVKAGMNRAGAGNNYGLSLIIDHGNGTKTLYAHCSALHVRAGESVKQGQHIADLGSTGRSSGPHLHFEIIRNGSRVPPQTLFNK